MRRFILTVLTVLTAGALAGCTQGALPGGPLTAADVVARKPAGTSALVVHLVGDGTGSITTDPVPSQCTTGDGGARLCWAYATAGGPSLRILPSPAAGSTFGGWLLGACEGAIGATCILPSDRDQILAAGFLSASAATPVVPRNLAVHVLGSGTGTVTATGAALVCTPVAGGVVFSQLCWAQVAGSEPPPSVTLQATPHPGDSTLGGWGAACAGVAGSNCTVALASDSTATVTFLRSTAVPLPPPATLSLSPATASIDACRALVFTATVPPGSDPAVSWSVIEPAGGTVVNGIYTAPPTAGTYHLLARSVANPVIVATAAVTVRPERVLSVAAVPGSAQVRPGGGLAFQATVTTSCGTYAAN